MYSIEENNTSLEKNGDLKEYKKKSFYTTKNTLHIPRLQRNDIDIKHIQYYKV